jgi:hypothetical protein
MRLTELLANEFLGIHRSPESPSHYTAMYDVLHALIDSSKPKNITLMNQLDYIYNNTSENLLVQLPISEELYFKYRALDIQSRGNFTITYRTRTGIEKFIQRKFLKLELARAKTKMFHIFTLVAAKYNYDMPSMDGNV